MANEWAPKRDINAKGMGYLNKARAFKEGLGRAPAHNKLGIGMSAAGLGLSATGLVLGNTKSKGDVRRERVNEQSLAALKKIHLALTSQHDEDVTGKVV